MILLLIGGMMLLVLLAAGAAGFAALVWRLGLACGALWFLCCTCMALASASEAPTGEALGTIFEHGLSGAVAVVTVAGVVAWIFGGPAALPDIPRRPQIIED